MRCRALSSLFVLLACASLCSAAVGFWCANAPSSPQDRRANKDQLTVATYNGEWLFLNRSNCPGSGCPWANEAEAEDHFTAVGLVLREINADIVNVVEVQDCNSLNFLNEAIGLPGYEPYLIQGTDTATGQNVGLLTRIDPIVAMQRYQEDGKDVRAEWPVSGEQCKYGQQGGYTSVSKHYYTRIRLSDGSGNDAGIISLIGMHFLAFPTDPPRCAQREGQARVMQALIQAEIEAGNQVIAMGDLNDYDGSVLDANSDEPTSRVLSFLKAPGLNNIAADVSNAATRYSAWYDANNDCRVQVPSEVSTIDHILVSNSLFSSVQSASYDHSYVPQCNPPNFESDHWPVVAVFNVQQLAALRSANITLLA